VTQRWIWQVTALVCLLPGLTSQLLAAAATPDVRPASADTSAALPEHPLNRVAVIGASATAGFGVTLRYDTGEFKTYEFADIAEVTRELIRHDDSKVSGLGNALFFTSPLQIGRRQIDLAHQADPTLLLALDFLFWYGYGGRDVERKLIPRGQAGEATRLALLDRGLAMLDEFSCPIAVGDFPNVSDAVAYMLQARQIPSPGVLQALNARVHAWASEHPNVILIPLASIMDSMNSDEAFEAGQRTWPAGSKGLFVQRDHLHPTLDGMIVVLQETATHIAAQLEVVELSDFDLDYEAVKLRLYQANQPEGSTADPPGTPTPVPPTATQSN
jgi:hypothetical protein